MTSVNATVEVTISLAERAVEATVLAIIFSLAVVGNFSLWLVIRRTRELRNEANFLLLSLSGADLLVSLLSMPITIVNITMGKWTFPQKFCTALGFISMTVFIASVMSLGAISVNRFVRVCRPQYYRRIYTTRNVLLMILGVWTFAALLATPPLIGWGVFDFLPNQSFCFCDWKTSVSYTFFMVGTCFGGPSSVMTVCYILIFRTFRQSRRRIADKPSTTVAPPAAGLVPSQPSAQAEKDSSGKAGEKTNGSVVRVMVAPCSGEVKPKDTLRVPSVSFSPVVKDGNSSSCPSGDRKEPPTSREDRKEKRRQEELRLSLSFLVIIGVFVTSWLPFCVTMFITVLSDYVIPRPADMATLLLGYANSCYNPILYGFLNTSFKQAYIKLFGDVCCAVCRRWGKGSDLGQSSKSKTAKSMQRSMAPTSSF